MYIHDINSDFLQIISGTSNKLSREFTEAKSIVEGSKNGALGYLKKFITSIDALSNQSGVKDGRISSTRGNIREFVGFDNIKTSMDFMKNNLHGVKLVKDLDSLFNSIQNYQPQYTEGYNKNINLIILEYESAVDLLVTGITLVMASNVAIVHNGTKIKVTKKGSDDSSNVTAKVIKEFASQLANKNHREYLEGILKTSSSVTNDDAEINEAYQNPYSEATFIDTIGLIDRMVDDTGRIIKFGVNTARAIKNSLFGIVPLIRSALYIKYKKKADTINALDQQVGFIKMNIEQLENITTMDPAKKAEIIQKQKAVIEQYEKRAAKLRAELTDGEREASTSINNENPQMRTPSNITDKDSDDDFVLEYLSSDTIVESTDDTGSKYVKLIDVISNGNSELMKEFQEYWNDFEGWKSKHKDWSNRTCASNDSEHREHGCALQFALYLLSGKKFVANMDWKYSLSDYMYAIKPVINAHGISVDINEKNITADDVPEITSQINDIIKDKGITIVDIYTDSDSYDLIPCKNDKYLNNIKSAAESAGTRIRLPKKRTKGDYIFEEAQSLNWG